MKKEILLVLYSLIIGTASAQYQIDLSKVTPPSVSFLQLGNAGPAGRNSCQQFIYGRRRRSAVTGNGRISL